MADPKGKGKGKGKGKARAKGKGKERPAINLFPPTESAVAGPSAPRGAPPPPPALTPPPPPPSYAPPPLPSPPPASPAGTAPATIQSKFTQALVCLSHIVLNQQQQRRRTFSPSYWTNKSTPLGKSSKVKQRSHHLTLLVLTLDLLGAAENAMDVSMDGGQTSQVSTILVYLIMT